MSDMSNLLSQVVINTRPVERAEPLTQHLQAAGLTVVDMPMLALHELDTSSADVDIMRRWQAGDYQALVIVSPTAAASGLAVWQALKQQAQTADSNSEESKTSANKAPSHIIAVGAATAAVLQQAKWPIDYQVLQPTVANNEGMLAMPEIESLQAGDKLLVWRGLGGRRLLVNTLQARGVHIDSIAWYERTLPVDASANYQRWHKQFMAQLPTRSKPPKPIVVISSGTAFEHWSEMVNQVQPVAPDTDTSSSFKLTDFVYIVLGERLAEMVAAEKLSYWRIEDLSPATILDAIKHGNLQTAK